MKPCNPVDLRSDFEAMLEIDIAYIDWLARCGATENYLPLINELNTNNPSDPENTSDTEGRDAPIVPQVQFPDSLYESWSTARFGA